MARSGQLLTAESKTKNFFFCDTWPMQCETYSWVPNSST